MKKDVFERIKKHLESLHQKTDAKVEPKGPRAKCENIEFSGGMKLVTPPAYATEDKIATRAAYGTALKKMGEANRNKFTYFWSPVPH